MKLLRPEPGLVIRYNFLWRREADAGREDASKMRPCAIIASVRREGTSVLVTVVPLTHSPPAGTTQGIEVPGAVKRSLQLDEERSWIVTDELNTFRWPGPDLEAIQTGSDEMSYGRLPNAFLAAVIRSVLQNVRNGRTRATKRTE